MNEAMVFDLHAARLGDVLLAMPSMREGDVVIAPDRARVPGLQVTWQNVGKGLRPSYRKGCHATTLWLEATQREAIRHQLLPESKRDLLVLAPCVESKERQWHGWLELARLLDNVVWLGDTESRAYWMDTLSRAHTVVCPDTGTAHMADALGCPRVVGLFGKNLDRYAPYWGRGAHCIERADMTMAATEVAEVVRGDN